MQFTFTHDYTTEELVEGYMLGSFVWEDMPYIQGRYLDYVAEFFEDIYEEELTIKQLEELWTASKDYLIYKMKKLVELEIVHSNSYGFGTEIKL